MTNGSNKIGLGVHGFVKWNISTKFYAQVFAMDNPFDPKLRNPKKTKGQKF